MNTEITDAPAVSRRLEELGLEMPTGLVLLPRNLQSARSPDEFLYEELTPTLIKLFRASGIDEVLLSPCVSLKTIHENASGWVIPTLFVSSMVLSSHPHVIALALNIIGKYLILGPDRNPEIALDILVEKARSSKKVSYRGDPADLDQLAKIVKGLNNGN